MEDTKLPLEQARAFMAVLEQLCRNPVAVDFHLPVATLFPEVDQEYSKVIEHPMDLSTVVSNLRNGRYKDSKRLIRHVHRIFLNCKKFNLKSNRIFYNRADHLSDYFDSLLAERGLGGAGGGGGGGGDALALPARRRLACHQAAARAPLRGRWLARAVAAVEGCGLPLGPAARAALGAVRAKGEVEYRQFLELALALFGYDPKANPLGVVFDQLTADHNPPGAAAAAAAEGEGAAAAAAQGAAAAAAAAAAGQQWAAVERALLAVAAEALELMFRGNDFSCVWGVPWRFVWAKTRAKEALWPAIVLADADAPPEVEAINMRRVPRGIVSELRRQKARTPDPVLVEFFGTNEFAWVREGLLEPFRGRGDRRTTLPQGPKRERWGAAVYDLDLALRDLKETFAAAAADPLPAKKGHKDGGGGGGGAPELPPQLRFEIDAAAFAVGAADPDSEISDFEEEDAEPGAQRERSAPPGGRRASLGGSAPPSPSSSSARGGGGGGGGGGAAGAGGRLVGRRFKPALLRRLAAFSALCREDPEFLAAYDLDKAGAREEKRRARAARRGRLVARVGAFVAAVRRETPDFDEAYELDKISPYRRRMALIEERIAQKTARLPRKYTLPPPPVAGGAGGGAKAGAGGGAGGGAGKPLRKEDYQSIVTVTPSLWRAYEVYHRGRAPRAQDALEFYVNLHPRALAQKVEFCRNLKKPPPPAAEEEDKEGGKGDLEGATDSEEEEEEEGEGGEGGGAAAAAAAAGAPLEGRHYPEGPESHPRCADRKAYLRALAGLLAADLAALRPLRRAARRALAHPAVAPPPPPPGEAVSKGQKRPAPSSAAGGGKGGAVAKKQKALPKVAVAAKATMALKNQNGTGAGGASPGGSGPPKREYKTSKYRGVCFQANAFIARISVDGKVQSLGRFGTEAEAARAYDRRARQVFGKRAMTNFNADGEENHYDASYMNQHGMEHPDSISESSDEEGRKGTSKSNNAERSYSFSDSGDGSSGSEAEQVSALASRRPAASASSFIIPA